MKINLRVLAALALVHTHRCAQPSVVTIQPAGHAVWAGANVRFAVGVSGNGPFTYQWLLDSTNLPDGSITTIAGNGLGGGSGDGGPAVNARLLEPAGLAIDGYGNLFVADSSNQSVRKIDTNGIITTVATGLNYPYGVVVDRSGNLFIADTYNYVIRKVDANGTMTTVAGNGRSGYLGDGGLATRAELYSPHGVGVDASGNVFIADNGNARIRKVNTNGIITTVVGNGGATYSGDGGPATAASLDQPYQVVVDGVGNLWIADAYNNRVRFVGTNGIITTVAGGGTNGLGDGGMATNAGLAWPYGVALDGAGNLYIGDYDDNRIRRVDTNGIITTIAGNGTGWFSGDGGPGTNADIWHPWGVATDTAGNVFFADQYNLRIRKITNTQGPILTLNNVDTAHAGSYQVVVTGPGGSVTSSVANLFVATAPVVYGTVRNPGSSLTFSCVSPPGSANVVLCTTNLSTPLFWKPLSTNLAASDGSWQFTDTNASACQTCFYSFVIP
jgi:hypothetical protein